MNSKDALKRIETIMGSNEPNYYLNFTDSVIPFKEDIKLIEKDLEKLEDIEKELGIDLIKLFKALKNGIFVEEQNTNEKEIVFEEITLNLNNKLLLFRHPRKEIGKGRNIFQYGKTWALTKEELENGN